MPDLLLFMYEKIRKVKNVLTSRRSNEIMVSGENNAGVLASSDIQCTNSLENHDKLERIVIINRLSKLEDNTGIIFEMLDKIRCAIDNLVERQNNV